MTEDFGKFKMYFEITGKDDAPWLILLHGIAGSSKCWKYQIDELSKHFKVLNLELVGHGSSSNMEASKYSGLVVANHVRMLLDRLNINKVHLLGISLGTIIQQYFCELFPERVLSTVMAGPITKPNYLSAIMNSFVDKIFLRFVSKDTYLKLMGNLMLPGKVHEKSRKFFLQETLKMSDAEFKKWWKVVVQGDHYFYLNKSEIPALIVTGEDDFCFYSDAVALKEIYRNHVFHVIKGAGHVFIFQKPQEFNGITVDFIKSVENEENSSTEYWKQSIA